MQAAIGSGARESAFDPKPAELRARAEDLQSREEESRLRVAVLEARERPAGADVLML